jgi:ATP-binding cassette, subfamily F, member 3
MIQLTNLFLRRGTRLLMQDVNFTMNFGQKVGLIGENGAGKSSLIALILGELSPDSGNLSIPNNLSIAHLAQEIPALEQLAIDYVLDGDTELRRIEKALETAEDGNEIAELYSEMAAIDGYTAPARAAQLMHGLNFKPEEQQFSVKDFSGGWRMRLNLARTLMSRADLMLLDEPTNHLDLDAIVWLEEWLKNTKSTVLLISHDRDFLDNVVTHIASLARRQLKGYTGNYSDYERQRATELAIQQANFVKQERQKAHWQKFVDRFKVIASKAKQVQSRLNALSKMDTAHAIHADSPFQFEFREAPYCSNPMLSLEHVDIGYSAENPILKDTCLSFTLQDRIGLIGPNGAGKSTLIKCLMGKLKPLSGEYFANPALRIGYFDQHQLDSLDLEASAALHIQRLSPKTTEQEIRNYLGRFGFMGDQAMAKIENFSGGEKSRLALALLIWEKPNLLLLDEPTNHLDLEMRHALVVALQSYEGALIIVSHDRHLLRACTDRFLWIANQKVDEYEGDLEEYEQALKNYRRTSADSFDAASITDNNNSKEQRASDKKSANKLKKLEENIARLTQEKQKSEVKLSDEALYQPDQKTKLDKLLAEQKRIIERLETAEKEWMESQG